MQALKEWAVVCKALQEGRQTVLLRKGGILEYKQGFEVKHEKFLLFPTYEHQAKENLQQDYVDRLDAVIKEQPPTGKNLLNCYAESKLVREVNDSSILKKLEKYHIWNENYVNSRMAYNPKKPMSVILLRVYNLPSPVRVDTQEEWSGCKSWIPVDFEATGNPAVDDATFDKISNEVAEVLN